jgi:hypothetical protein
MLNEFSHRGKTYCIKTPMDSDYSEDETIKFNQLQDVQSFFKAAMNDSGAWAVIMSIAKWNYPFSCRPPKRCPEPTDQEFFDTFCQQIYSGELTLIEKKPVADWEIKDMQLPQCCIETIQEINGIIMRGHVLTAVMAILPFFQAFFYPPGYSEWASLCSTVISITTEDWKAFGEDVMRVPEMTRASAYKVARDHAIEHEWKNDYKLKIFWQGVVHAFE